jgi:hypothetical protein
VVNGEMLRRLKLSAYEVVKSREEEEITVTRHDEKFVPLCLFVD